MTVPYRIHLEAGPAVSTLRLEGEFDMCARDELREAVVGAVTADQVHGLVVDLGAVTFLDSEAIGALIAGYLAAEQTGRSFRLANPSGMVRRVLTVTGLLDLSLAGAQSPPISAARRAHEEPGAPTARES